MLTQDDKALLAQKGISEAQIAAQLACFEKGFPYLKLEAAASIGNGIMATDACSLYGYVRACENY